MYEIIISQIAQNQLYKLEKDVQKRILAVLERIRIRPESYVRKLVGEEGYRLRVGDYRVILDIVKGKLIVFVIKIGHRSKVYN